MLSFDFTHESGSEKFSVFFAVSYLYPDLFFVGANFSTLPNNNLVNKETLAGCSAHTQKGNFAKTPL